MTYDYAREAIASLALEPVDGFTLTAYMLPDDMSRLDDSECYGPEDIEAYEAGRWSFVGVAVVAEYNGVAYGDASIWGMEYGTWADGSELDPLADGPGFVVDGVATTDFANGYGSGLVADALAEARTRLEAVHARSEALHTLATLALELAHGHGEPGVYVDAGSRLSRAVVWLSSDDARELIGDGYATGDPFNDGEGPVWLDGDGIDAHGAGYATATVDMSNGLDALDGLEDDRLADIVRPDYGVNAGEYVRGYRDGRASYNRRFDAR